MALKASDVIVAWLSRNIDIWGGDCEIADGMVFPDFSRVLLDITRLPSAAAAAGQLHMWPTRVGPHW